MVPRALAAAMLVPLLLSAVVPTTGAIPLAEGCDLPPFVPGTQEIRAAPGEFVAARFRLDEPTFGTWWAAVAFRASTTSESPMQFGASAERAVVTAFYERADGTLLATPNAFLFPYGVTTAAPGVDARVSVFDGQGCGGLALGPRMTLEAGEYRVVVLGATELGSATSALLPAHVEVVEVARGAAHVLTESAFDCDVNVRAGAAGFSSATLLGCATEYEASSRAYRLLYADRADPDHQVFWTGPDGTIVPKKRFDIGRGTPGEWTLEIPRYATTLGSSTTFPPPWPPMSSDAGVYGVFADVP